MYILATGVGLIQSDEFSCIDPDEGSSRYILLCKHTCGTMLDGEIGKRDLDTPQPFRKVFLTSTENFLPRWTT